MAGFVAVVLGTLSAIGLGAAAALGTAAVATTPATFLAVGLLAVIVLTFVAGWAGFRVMRVRRPMPAAGGLAVATGLVVCVVASATILRPFPPHPATPIPSDVRFWNLPTGSRIAYVHAPQRIRRNRVTHR
ncbi:hypothetical protein P9209_16180 [Prescottella defluvii]|nr:hypothetical protein P9209_16180 [Prescottella defluvii]